MKRTWIFALAGAGLVAGLIAAYLYGIQRPAQPPVFTPASNPYQQGVYAEGIVESDQPAGENINVYPSVAGAVTRLAVQEGQAVKAGDVLLAIDDSVQRASAAQLDAQAVAAAATLDELKAQPRKEALAVADAQVTAAQASLKLAQDTYEKQQHAFDADPRSVSRDTLDSAANTFRMARANLEVVARQDRLTRAGAWVYDVRNQAAQVEALRQAARAAGAQLAYYTVRAPADGVVLSINASQGAYVAPQGVYDTYREGQAPVVVLGAPASHLAVRCYVDEILIQRLSIAHPGAARMFVRGTGISAPLEFVRVQPYVTPKIELSDQREERVDVRVLPVIFRIGALPSGMHLYPGQLVDVYIATR